MPPPWPPSILEAIRAELADLDARSLRRRLHSVIPNGRFVERDGRRLLNLAGNDYLALAGHPRLKQAATKAIERYGTGSGASRLVSGHLALHARVEARFAAFKHPPGSPESPRSLGTHQSAALLFPTGYTANLAALTALTGPGDLICLDKLVHASLIDAARASGAAVRVFPHLNVEKLERLLQRDAERGRDEAKSGLSAAAPLASSRLPPRSPRRLIVTDSVFSMDGDIADLPRLCDLAEQYEAVLVVDEAHATGVLGEHGSGLCELQGVADRVHVVISTAGKALGSLGGIVTSCPEVIDLLINRARSFIYTTAGPPAQAATIDAALDVVRDEPWRRQRLTALSRRLRQALADRGWTLPATPVPTPIIPLIVGKSQPALALADSLEEAGILAVAIRPPTVAAGSARVRISLRADLEDADLDRLLDALPAR